MIGPTIGILKWPMVSLADFCRILRQLPILFDLVTIMYHHMHLGEIVVGTLFKQLITSNLLLESKVLCELLYLGSSGP